MQELQNPGGRAVERLASRDEHPGHQAHPEAQAGAEARYGTHEDAVLARAQWAVHQKQYTGHGVGVPVVLMGADGAGSVALAAELCEGWQPSVFLPEQAGEVFGPWLAEGSVRRSAGLGPLEVVADVVLRVTDDEADLVKALGTTRRHLARLVGAAGEGSDVVALLTAFGYGREVERCLALQASGDAEAAALALGDSLPRQVSLVGSRAEMADRVRAFRAAGVSTFVSRPVAEEPADRVADVVALRELLQ